MIKKATEFEITTIVYAAIFCLVSFLIIIPVSADTGPEIISFNADPNPVYVGEEVDFEAVFVDFDPEFYNYGFDCTWDLGFGERDSYYSYIGANTLYSDAYCEYSEEGDYLVSFWVYSRKNGMGDSGSVWVHVIGDSEQVPEFPAIALPLILVAVFMGILLNLRAKQ